MDDIEEGCIVGAGSIVNRKIDAYSVCAGNPATIFTHGVCILPF
jgi:acetyltransferase-like isoleucine patch superfamily enzyme